MTQPLNNSQLMALMQNGPQLDDAASALAPDMQQKLLDLQKRAGETYAAGSWAVPATGQVHAVPMRCMPPTREEAQGLLGQAYMALSDKRRELREVMDQMDLNPSARKGVMSQIIDNIQGFFR